MQEIILVKVGGSVITEKENPYTVREEVITALTEQIKMIKQPMIIVHGSGSFGHTSARKYGGKKGYKSRSGIAKVSYDARDINHIVMKTFIEHNLPAVAISPMSMLLAHEGKLHAHLFSVITSLLQQRLIPVLYGDVIWDTSWNSTIFSGETVLSELVVYLSENGYKVSQVILVTDTNGVYDTNKQTIPIITKDGWRKMKNHLFTSQVTDVTGGMTHKVESALAMIDYSTAVFIINGFEENSLLKAIAGEKVKGTSIRAK